MKGRCSGRSRDRPWSTSWFAARSGGSPMTSPFAVPCDEHVRPGVLLPRRKDVRSASLSPTFWVATRERTAGGLGPDTDWIRNLRAHRHCRFARRVRQTLLKSPAGLRAWVAPLILFLKPRFCAGDRRFQTEYAARANGMRRRSFIVLLESPSNPLLSEAGERPRGLRELPHERPRRNVTSSTARRFQRSDNKRSQGGTCTESRRSWTAGQGGACAATQVLVALPRQMG